jgi:intradiol ring-cleaving dioxygenase-like protein
VSYSSISSICLDEAERRAGLAGGTVRTIEGPLYIAGAPILKRKARLDDGTDDGEGLFMEGEAGRHGNRPAHVDFFVSAPGYRKLTTQLNIDGDKYLHDDFAFGTRNELHPPSGAHYGGGRDLQAWPQ